MSELKTKEFKSPSAMLQWQWRSMIEELNELQRHASDPTCPCVLADSGEYCLQKHALGLHTLAKETIAMAPEHTEMLEQLAEEALDQHNALNERIVCSKPSDTEKDTVIWSRQWRKKIEQLYYRTACKVNLKQKLNCTLHQEPKVKISGSVCKALHKSISEEGQAITTYGERAEQALNAGDRELERLYSHTAEDETQHKTEFQDAARVRGCKLEAVNKAVLNFDPLLTAIGCQIGVGCMASSEKISKLPVCDKAQRKERERIIKAIKETLPSGCNSKEWNKPLNERQEGCVNPYAIASVSAGCRIGKKR
jgi:rubrerythrin